MNPETIDSIKSALIPVAEKIGQTAELGWEVVVRQQYIEGVLSLVYVIIGSFFTYLIYKGIKKHLEGCDDWYDSNPLVVIFGSMTGLFSALTVVTQTNIAITHLLNPEFYAIQFFIQLVK